MGERIGINDQFKKLNTSLEKMEGSVLAASKELENKVDIQPSDLLAMQVNMTLYTTQLQMITNLVKGLGDAAKAVARNMA